ncbi:unnamed protein product [Schistocephalus solidus]|uniref:Protein-L-isoaspartate O-methyltransferase domain-containing protein 2 n=1 Tax=Schistocephalus solidus TaxID=70667 RepID=A0A183SM52_SCHSO|nr:unnamed protein product [Schistocephalus solidus]
MGGSVSCFSDNQSLVDSLLETCELPKDLERIMRLVDRGFYSTKPKDHSAWRSGDLHLSSPSIYCTVLREMELKPGISVLNIGSGTGFLSTLFGLVLGTCMRSFSALADYIETMSSGIGSDVAYYRRTHQDFVQFRANFGPLELTLVCPPRQVK